MTKKADEITICAIAKLEIALEEAATDALLKTEYLAYAGRVYWKSKSDWLRLEAGISSLLGEKYGAWLACVTEEAGRQQQKAAEYVQRKRELERGPMLILPSVGPDGDTVTVNKCAEAMYGYLESTGTIFVRQGRVVIVRIEADGGTTIELMTPAMLAARVQRRCNLMAWRSRGKSDSGPVLAPQAKLPLDTAKILLATPEAQDWLPPIASILRCPGLVVEGDQLIALQPGYNSEGGGILVSGNAVVEDVPLEQAVPLLTGLFDEFDFVTSGDLARAICMFITFALRMAGAFSGNCPIFLIEADNSQSGKGYLVKLCVAVFGERISMVTQRSGGVGSFDESLSSRLAAGNPLICIDNWRGKLNSPALEAILTHGGVYGCRIPHRGEVPVDLGRFMFIMTSNGVDLTRDMANRTCVIRIKKKPFGYDFKQYPEGDLLAHVETNQPRYLGAVHAVVRAWWQARHPGTTTTEHSFRGWARSLDWISQNILKVGPLLQGHQEVQERTSDPGRTWVRAIALLAISRSKDSWSASNLAELSQEAALEVPGVQEDANGDVRARVIGGIMKRVLGEKDAVIVDEIAIERTEVSVAGYGGKPRKEYRFVRISR